MYLVLNPMLGLFVFDNATVPSYFIYLFIYYAQCKLILIMNGISPSGFYYLLLYLAKTVRLYLCWLFYMYIAILCFCMLLICLFL